MAVLNPRLLELIETLVAARLDWLAFELIEGIQAGHPPDEPEEALAAARTSIRSGKQPKAHGEPYAIAMEAKPIPPDEQIEWAAAYVEERLGEALEQLQASIDTLDFLVEGTTGQPGEAGVLARPKDASKPRAVVVLLDLENDRKSGSDNVAGARENLPALRTAPVSYTHLDVYKRQPYRISNFLEPRRLGQ